MHKLKRLVLFLGILATVSPFSLATPAWLSQVDLSLGGGYSIAQSQTSYYDHSQNTMWGSLGYFITPHFALGLEGGHFFSKETSDQSVYSDDETSEIATSSVRLSSTYVGPYIQGEISAPRLSVYARAGAGVAIAKASGDYSTTTTYGPTYGSYSQTLTNINTSDVTDLGVALAVGAKFQLISSWSLGIGLRDLMLIRHESTFSIYFINDRANHTFTDDAPLRARHIFMPFAELSWRFGHTAGPVDSIASHI